MIFGVEKLIADGVHSFFYFGLNLLLFVAFILLFDDVFLFVISNSFSMFDLLLLVEVDLALLYQMIIFFPQEFRFLKMLNS